MGEAGEEMVQVVSIPPCNVNPFAARAGAGGGEGAGEGRKRHRQRKIKVGGGPASSSPSSSSVLVVVSIAGRGCPLTMSLLSGLQIPCRGGGGAGGGPAAISRYLMEFDQLETIGERACRELAAWRGASSPILDCLLWLTKQAHHHLSQLITRGGAVLAGVQGAEAAGRVGVRREAQPALAGDGGGAGGGHARGVRPRRAAGLSAAGAVPGRVDGGEAPVHPDGVLPGRLPRARRLPPRRRRCGRAGLWGCPIPATSPAAAAGRGRCGVRVRRERGGAPAGGSGRGLGAPVHARARHRAHGRQGKVKAGAGRFHHRSCRHAIV